MVASKHRIVDQKPGDEMLGSRAQCRILTLQQVSHTIEIIAPTKRLLQRIKRICCGFAWEMACINIRHDKTDNKERW
jgi:hypothetical protein